jgi:hypothetical protein
MTDSLFSADACSEKINSIRDARYILNQLDGHHPQLNVWIDWAEVTLSGQPWWPHLNDAMHIAYARMCHRNGSLSRQPRSYHNEFHCNDLCHHLIECHQHYSELFSPIQWALLSYFSVCHDLQQGLAGSHPNQQLIGANEAASFQEALQIYRLNIADYSETILDQSHHQTLLKTMIEGSTFGRHADNKRYFFQGNIAKFLLKDRQMNSETDQQLVYLACDIDTANVSMPFDDYARTAIRIYDELRAHRLIKVSARIFFSDEQINYFFNQQQFNSKPAKALFQQRKLCNAPLLEKTVKAVKELPENTDTDTIKHTFFKTAQDLSTAL